MAPVSLQFKASRITYLLFLGLFASGAIHAQTSLRSAVEKSLTNNPEMTSRINAYKASIDAVSVARGGWRPKIDLSANAGRDETSVDGRSPENQHINRSGAELTLSQLLWDGSATRSETKRLGHERLVSYFEARDFAEQTALEAARAHLDVIRFRRLVQLAEANYVEHKHSLLQIESRFKAGVSRGVDFEQANARLALAESNLTTEQANLHDVTARYQRIVGELPAAELTGLDVETGMLKQGIPAHAEQAVQMALLRNTAISAAIEGVRASQAAVTAREAAYQPRVEARLRGAGGNNLDSVNNQTLSSTAEVVMNWNLYNGNVDQARVRQQVSILNQAMDLRDKVCRDTRQGVEIAFNDTQKLREQLGYLARNELSIEKARDAYRQQFDIGQRSLLDLLNSENELYTARRAHASAQFDLAIAYARTHAAVHQLTAQAGIARPLGDISDAPNWSAEQDSAARCPVQATTLTYTNRSVLDAKAQALSDAAPKASPPPAAANAAPAKGSSR